MKRFLTIAILLAACSRDARPQFERAVDAANAGDFRAAAKLFAEAKTPEAELRLANIEWRALHAFDSARARLERLGSYDARMELARLALTRKDFAAARASAERARELAKTDVERRRATLARIHVFVSERNLHEVRESLPALRELIAIDGPRLHPTRLLARAGVLLDDRATLLEGVNGYYHVTGESGPPHLIAAAHAELAKATTREELARALAGIRFFEEASLVAPPQSEIARYAAMLERMKQIADEHYRQISLGDEDGRRLRRQLTAELKTMWPTLDFDQAVAEMGRLHGGYLILGKTGGFQDTHIAHKVVDRALVVEQYGRKAQVRFIALDGVVSNGFQSWRSDGKSGDGGWGTHTEIVQVRPLYADGALQDWQRVTDPQVRAKYLAAEPRAAPLRMQYLDRVRAETKTRAAFLARVEADEFRDSIVLHEGRHAVDDASGERFKAWELEYRAKLSQIALSSSPRASLASIVGDVIGGDSPHGKANEKLMSEMRKMHGGKPFEQWTDEEIRAAAASLDPLAKAPR
jgi:hypothetical protein